MNYFLRLAGANEGSVRPFGTNISEETIKSMQMHLIGGEKEIAEYRKLDEAGKLKYLVKAQSDFGMDITTEQKKRIAVAEIAQKDSVSASEVAEVEVPIEEVSEIVEPVEEVPVSDVQTEAPIEKKKGGRPPKK